MSQEQLNNIERTLGTILGELKGINSRLDTTNGRVKKSEERIDCLETDNDKAKASIKIFSWLWTALISVTGIVLALLKIK